MDNLSFGDVAATRNCLLVLKNATIDENISAFYQKKLDLTVQLFNYGADAFKMAQLITEDFDTRILNEHQYFSRALTTIAENALNGVLNVDSLFAVDDALSAVRHILNDTLDLIVVHAINERDRLNALSTTISLSDVYKEYDQIRPMLLAVNEKISHTRRVRGVMRIESYLEMFESGQYAQLVKFCQDISEIEDRIKRKKTEQFAVARRIWIGMIISAFVAITAAGISLYIKFAK